MSQRDLVHVMNALATLSRATVGVPVATTAIDEAIGRSPGDWRTTLNLASLVADGRVAAAGDDAWALTDAGLAALAQDAELS
jgi:hypothetical protein